MKRWIILAIVAGAFSTSILFFQVKPVLAKAPAANYPVIIPTRIVINDPGDIFESKPFILSGSLKDDQGNGLAGKHVSLILDGSPIGQAPVDNNGYFQLVVNKSFSAGTHLLTINYGGGRLWTTSTSSIYILIYPATELDLTQLDSFVLGTPFTIMGVLKDQQTGQGIPNQTVSFSLNGQHFGQTTTDAIGYFRLLVAKPIDAATYLVSASFNGARHVAPADSYLVLKILPTQIKVQTVPPVAGITFLMDGIPFVSGQDGLATVEISQVGQYRLDALTGLYNNPAQQVTFGRWESESYLPYRMVNVPSTEVVMVGLNLFHQVGVSFSDLDGFAVDPNRVTSVTVRSVQGDVFDLKIGKLQWLPSSRTARRQSGLQETDLLYSVINVTIDGSNVVNSAQQKFYLNQNGDWKISLLLYTLHLSAVDGLFGTPIGKSIDLEYPDGQVKNFPLDSAGNVTVHSLARGNYHATLVDAKGLGTTVPVALSKQQYVTLKVVTPMDMAAAGALGVGMFFGLIFYGRPWLIRYPFKKQRPQARLDAASHEN